MTEQPDGRAAAVIARIRRATTLALSYDGRLEQAVSLAERNRADADAAGAGVEASRALLSLMHPLLKLGRAPEAIAAGERAHGEFVDQGRHDLAARADVNLANIRKSLGNAEASLLHLDRARGEIGEDAAALAHIENTRGEVLHSLDRFDEARAAFLSALEWATRANAGFAAAVVEGNLADLAARAGRLHESLERFARARDGVTARGHAARLLLEEADVLQTLGLSRAAVDRLLRGLSIVDELGLAFEAITAHLALARACASLGELPAAHRHAMRAAEQAAGVGNRSVEARARTLDAIIQVRAGALSEARAALDMADAAEPVPSPSDAVARALARCRCLEAAGRPREAVDAALGAASIAGAIAAAPLESDAMVQVARLRRRLGEADGAISAATAAVDAAERVRSSLGSERLRGAYLGRSADAFEELVLARLDAGGAGAARAALEAVERSKSRSLMERLRSSDAGRSAAAPGIAALRRELDRAYRSLAHGGVDAAPVHALIADLERRLMHEELDALRGASSGAPFTEPAGIDRIQGSLDADEAVVEYFRADGRWHAFVLDRSSVRHAPLPMTDAACDDAVRRLGFQVRRALRAAAAGSPAAGDGAAEPLEALGRMLWRPIAAMAPLPERLRIVPHGRLHAVPFAAVTTEGRSLIDSHEIGVLPSSGVLPVLREREGDGRKGALVVGVADQHAPAIADEAAAVARSLGAASLIGDEATAAVVAQALATAGTAHLACHGQFLPEAPWSSGLRLADSWFGLRAVLELPRAPELVVLSGCDTGGHEVLAGDELIGLVHAFLSRGARTVVASLWPVHDRSTTQLMLDLYAASATISDRRRFAASLRSAQLRERERSPHPAFWAPFFSTGA